MTVLLAKPKLETIGVETPKRFKLARQAISILAWQILALLLVEGILYSAGIGEEEIFKLDPQIGFVHMTNRHITWRQEGMGAHSYFDADGMREPNLTIAKPPETYRIALLGDSQVEGLQVPIQDTFGQQLERQLERSPQSERRLPACFGKSSSEYKQVQVLNFATSGYSTVQEYLQLKSKVFKYQPDMVILGYSARDLFENWSPPDQAITNVRPFALHLPGAHLVVDSSPVTQWMRTPRAKFLTQISWLREHSRIWGLIAAQEQQLTLDNSLYKTVAAFISQPGKSIRAAVAAGPSMIKSIPANFIGLFQKNDHEQKPAAPHAVSGQNAVAHGQTSGSTMQAGRLSPADHSEPTHAPTAVAPVSNQNFLNLITRTMGSLLAEMNAECKAHNAKFCVLVMPSKAALCPNNSAGEGGSSLAYNQEVQIVHSLCHSENIPLVDSERPATLLTPQQRQELYFNVHLRPEGHAFVAKVLLPIVSAEIAK